MKYIIINLKNKIVSLFENIKNRIMPFIMKNKLIASAIAVVLLVVILVAIISCSTKGTENTIGNLNNLGFSVKSGNWIYYLGYNEGNADGIYRVKENGNKKEKVSDSYGYYLNESGSYIYYLDSQESNLVKIKKNGEDKEVIVTDVDYARITVSDNWIYYFKNSSLYRIKTNGENKQKISNKSIENYQVVGNWIYYSYYNDGEYIISKMKTNGEDINKIDSKAGKVFFVDGKTIYYINQEYNKESLTNTYKLYKIGTNGKNKEKIIDINGKVDVDTINFDGKYIYYAKINEENEFGIYKIKINGKNESKIVSIEGYSTSINIHQNWIYYPDQNDDGEIEIYRIKTNGKDKQSL